MKFTTASITPVGDCYFLNVIFVLKVYWPPCFRVTTSGMWAGSLAIEYIFVTIHSLWCSTIIISWLLKSSFSKGNVSICSIQWNSILVVKGWLINIFQIYSLSCTTKFCPGKVIYSLILEWWLAHIWNSNKVLPFVQRKAVWSDCFFHLFRYSGSLIWIYTIYSETVAVWSDFLPFIQRQWQFDLNMTSKLIRMSETTHLDSSQPN